MSRYISLMVLFVFALFFVGCEKMEDFTNKSSAVYDASIRKGLVVVTAEDIPQTDLTEVVVEHKNNPSTRPNRFKLITSRSSKPQKGDSVDVVTVCYYINSDGVPGTWREILTMKKK